MLDDTLRQAKERAFTPLARLCGQLEPNFITVVACLVGLASAVAAWYLYFRLALGLWLLNRGLDGLDGTLARVTGRQTQFGGYLDLMLDLLVYLAIPASLVSGPLLALLFASFYVNLGSWMYLSALLHRKPDFTSIAMPSGLVEGGETILLYALALGFPHYARAVLSLMAGLVWLSALQRGLWAGRHLR